MPSQWREETGPHGAKRWVNLRTGHIQYRPPGSEHPKYAKAKAEKLKEGWEKFAEKAKQGGLTLPDEAVEKPKPKGKKQKDHFEAGLKASDLTSRMREKYGQTARDVHARLPAKARERFDAHVESVSFHESPEVLTAAVLEKNPAMKEMMKGGKKAGGAYSKTRKELLLNGGHTIDGKKFQADQIYAHEYTHAIDGPDKELSGSEAWREAWREEAQRVSKYATKTPAEGFAEFGRLVYSNELGMDQLQERYPKMLEQFKAMELLPEGMQQSAGELAQGEDPQMSDVLERPWDSEGSIGDVALPRRGGEEGLKDYLKAIGGEAAHDTIRDYAKQLHGEAKAEVDRHNSAVKMGFDTLSNYAGERYTANHHAFKEGDADMLPRFDEVATSVANEHPGLLSEGNETQDLYERMQEGSKPSPDLRDFEDQAVQEWHDNGRPMPEGYEPDTSFDFGGNEPKEEPHPFKSTPEEDKEAWDKFRAKMEHEANQSRPVELMAGDFIEIPKTKKAKQELAKNLQQEWLRSMKSAGLDADMPRTEEQKKHELNVMNRLRNLSSGRLHVGGMDNGQMTDEQYQHNHKSLLASIEFFKKEQSSKE